MKITFLGHATLEIKINEYSIIVDPFISGNPMASEINLDDLPDDMFDNGKIDTKDDGQINWEDSLKQFIRTQLTEDKDTLKTVGLLMERILIDESLRATNNTKIEAAKLLGWGRNTLARKIKDLQK